MPGLVKALFRNWFLSGILALVPLYITGWVLYTLIRSADVILELVPARYRTETLVGFHVPGLGAIITIFILISIGALVANVFGRRLLAAWEKILQGIPIVRWFYFSSKQVLESVFFKGNESFKKVVLVEFPRKGMHSIGFVTGEYTGKPPGERKGRSYMVFIPCTPNPTSGYLQIIPEEELVPVDWKVDQAFRFVVSAGIIPPGQPDSPGWKMPSGPVPESGPGRSGGGS